MKVVVFDIEPHEAPAFDRLAARHEIVRVDARLRADNVADFADANVDRQHRRVA
jgi:hypothetical protein